MSYAGAPPHQPGPYHPPFQRKLRKVGAPLGVIITLGTIAGLLVILLTAVNPVGTAIGFVLSSIAMTVVVLAYLWLDRWEPEPPRLLVFAFLWGATVAVVFSVVLGLILEGVFNPHGEDVSWASFVIGAPVIEEAAKGAFLLLMMTGRRRNELNSMTDCLVFAGITAAGFAWLEDILYIAGEGSLGDTLFTAALRLIMAPFAHPLFTTFTGIGVYFALQQRNVFAKAACILLGYIGAVLMHAAWNGSAITSGEAYLLTYVFWMMPIFGLAIVLAVMSRRREQKITAAKLPGMIQARLVTPNEATWLGSLRNRKLAIGEAARFGGKPAAKAVRTFAVQVVELAFVRDRIDRGFGDERVIALLHEETYWVHAARAAAPALQPIGGYRAPGAYP